MRVGEDSLRQALEAGGVGSLEWDLGRDVMVLSGQAQSLCGFGVDEFEGSPGLFLSRICEQDRLKFESAVQSSREFHQSLRAEFQIRRPDGSLCRLVCQGSWQVEPPGRSESFLGVLLEMPPDQAISQRDQEIDRLSNLYAALSQVNHAIVWTRERDELFGKVCKALVEQGRVKMAWIGLHDRLTRQIQPVASFGDKSNYLPSIQIFSDDRPEGRGPAGKAFREGRPHIRNHMLLDEEASPWHQQLRQQGWLAGAAFPIRQGEEVTAILAVYAGQAEFFQQREVALLTEVADDLSFALQNLQIEQQRREGEERLRHERDFSDALLNSLPGVLYLYNQEGKFLRWNRNFQRVSGYTAEEITQMHPWTFSQQGKVSWFPKRSPKFSLGANPKWRRISCARMANSCPITSPESAR